MNHLNLAHRSGGLLVNPSCLTHTILNLHCITQLHATYAMAQDLFGRARAKVQAELSMSPVLATLVIFSKPECRLDAISIVSRLSVSFWTLVSTVWKLKMGWALMLPRAPRGGNLPARTRPRASSTDSTCGMTTQAAPASNALAMCQWDLEVGGHAHNGRHANVLTGQNELRDGMEVQRCVLRVDEHAIDACLLTDHGNLVVGGQLDRHNGADLSRQDPGPERIGNLEG